MNRLRPATGPRYVARFQNGVNQVFDTVYYAPVDVKPTLALAQKRAAELNARPPKVKVQGGRR